MKVKIDWQRIERYSIYSGIALGVISADIESIWPQLKVVPGLLLGFALLGAFHYLIRAVEGAGQAGAAGGAVRLPLLDAFQEWIRPYDLMQDMRILSHTSEIYYQLVRSNRAKIGTLRLLLLVDDNTATASPSSHFDLEKTAAMWKALQTNGQISKLEIRRIRCQTGFYLSIADSDRLLAGLLWPNPDLSDVIPSDTILFTRHQSKILVNHFCNWFDEMWRIAHPVPLWRID